MPTNSLRQAQAAVQRAARRAANVDDQRRGARLRQFADLSLDLVGGLRADRRDAHVADAGCRQPAGDVGCRRRLARELDHVRVVRVAAEHRELDLGSRGAAQLPHALEHRHLARRSLVDRAYVVARSQPGLRGRRPVTRGDDRADSTGA